MPDMSNTPSPSDAFDVIVVGSGINSLVCAALLAKKGKSVCVLERNAVLGGCIRTEECTVPGFTHDMLSGFYPLFVTSPGYAELQADLEANGLSFAHSDCPTGVLLPDGRALTLRTSREANVAAFNAVSDGDGAAYAQAVDGVLAQADLTFTLLGSELWTPKTIWLLVKKLFSQGPSALAAFSAEVMQTCRAWLEQDFKSDLLQALFAPWVLHTGLGPDAAMSGFMNRVILFTLEAASMPIVKGGSANIVAAFETVITAHGGTCRTDADVVRVRTEGGRATGVELADGTLLSAREAVVCNVTPTQLYGRLLGETDTPAEVRRQAAAYRYGRADMQIHLALDAPPKWPDAALAQTVMFHMTPGLDGVTRAVAEAEAGLLPDMATIVVAQPTASDPSRAPEGKWILWLQLQELPRVIKGDARGEITVGADGAWTDEIANAYADRILARLYAQAPGLEQSVLGRRILGPHDLEAMNMNLVGGDPYSGACTLDQLLLWRPLKATKNHTTPVKGLYHIGASTHPGAGLGGGSGYLVAQKIR